MTATMVPRRSFWEPLDYAPHNGQVQVHDSNARHRVVCAGRRTGKSTLGGHELTTEALMTYAKADELRERGARREFWIVGPEYSDAEKEFRVLWNDSQRLQLPLDKPGSYNNPQSGEMILSLWKGTFLVHAKSAKYPGTLVGEGLSGVIMAEAAKLKPSVWVKYIRPTLADFRGWSLHTSTPEGRNWFYESWRRGQDPAFADWASWRMPSWVNNIVFPEGRDDPEILDMAADMSEEKFKQEIGAEFTEYVGRVFKDFDEEYHVTDLAYNPKLPLYLAIDYGWTNPFVCLAVQVDVFDNVYVIGEYRVSHRDTEDIAKDLLSWRGGLVNQAVKFYPDPAQPSDSALLKKHLKLPYTTNTGGPLKTRLEYIRKGLKIGPEHAPESAQHPKLYIDRSCVGMPLGDGGLIREMSDYRYPETKDERVGHEPEEPLKKDDHGPEALGRFYRGHYGDPASTGKGDRARVSKAKVRR